MNEEKKETSTNFVGFVILKKQKIIKSIPLSFQIINDQ